MSKWKDVLKMPVPIGELTKPALTEEGLKEQFLQSKDKDALFLNFLEEQVDPVIDDVNAKGNKSVVLDGILGFTLPPFPNLMIKLNPEEYVPLLETAYGPHGYTITLKDDKVIIAW